MGWRIHFTIVVFTTLINLQRKMEEITAGVNNWTKFIFCPAFCKGRPLYMTRPTVHVHDYCTCPGLLYMSRTTVHFQDYCTCPGLPYMSRTAVNDMNYRTCPGLLYISRTTVHVHDYRTCPELLYMKNTIPCLFRTSLHNYISKNYLMPYWIEPLPKVTPAGRSVWWTIRHQMLNRAFGTLINNHAKFWFICNQNITKYVSLLARTRLKANVKIRDLL